MPEHRRDRAALPAPLGALGEEQGIVADHRRKGAPRRGIAAERVGLLDQDLADQGGVANQQHIGGAPLNAHYTALIGGARNGFDVVAPQGRQPAQPERLCGRFEGNEVGIGVHGD